MAVKKPLVLGSDGRPQQLQSGDTLSAGSETGQINQTADASLVAGNVVYSSAADHVNKAQANAAGTLPAFGMATTTIASSGSGQIQVNGIVSFTTTLWDAVAGTTGGLTFNTTYYVDPTTAGKITATCPTTTGQYVQIVGVAISTTEMKLDFREPVLL